MTAPDYLISTPENVDLHLQLAGVGNRLLAALIDSLITMALILLVGLFTAFLVAVVEAMPLPDEVKTATAYCLFGILLLLVLSIAFGYYIFFEGVWHGQTPGKKVSKIRVMSDNGQPISWAQAIIRNLLRPVDTGVMLIGILSILADKKERRLGDFAAGTMVIREWHPAESGRPPKIEATLSGETFVDIGHVSPEEYQLLLTFLRRRDSLSGMERSALANKLAQHFRNKAIETSPQDTAELFLEKIYLAYQARAEEN